jgi:hypothetical protein
VWQAKGAIGAARALIEIAQVSSTLQRMGASIPGWSYLTIIGISIVQILIPVLLLLGGIALLCRRAGGRRLIATGCVLILTLEAFALFAMSHWLAGPLGNLTTHSPSLLVSALLTKSGMAVIVLPALLAVITLLVALSPATRQWCQPRASAPYGRPGGYGPPSGY